MFRPIPFCSSRLKYSSHVDQLLFSSDAPLRGTGLPPQLPFTSVVMPCLILLSIHGSTNMLVSEWLWTSINPGLTKSPSTSMTLSAFSSSTLPNRGLIKEGFRADITVFDLDNVKSTCTYEDDAMPGYPLGIPYVIVNGVPVIDNDQLTEALPGEVLRHSSA